MNNIRTNKGITLIALVITIIVLLILAGVSIATLTGENGILTKATTAKNKTTEAEEKEQINLAYTTVIADKLHNNSGNDLTVSVEELEKALNNQNANVTVAKADEEGKIKVTFNKSGNVYTINGGTGEITSSGNNGSQTPTEPEFNIADTVEEAIKQDKPFEEKKEIKDAFENKIVVPEGFKIAKDSGDNVTEGIVIEDVNHEVTAGSQFVWIPVGEVKYSGGMQTIDLSRYTFENDGTPTKHGNNEIWPYEDVQLYYFEREDSVKDFKIKAIENSGYYIGRYEARTAIQRTNRGQETTPVTVKPNDYVYNYTTKDNALNRSKEMYSSNTSSFASDLMNSYAWDTAIVFLQKFDNRADKTLSYSRQYSLNTDNVAEKGTNNLANVNQQDKICNVWDMAGNTQEWTTERASEDHYPGVTRGGWYGGTNNNVTSKRISDQFTSEMDSHSFRVILY